MGLSSCSSHNPSAACLPEGVGRETAAVLLAGIASSENSAPCLCRFGVLGSWPQSGTETLQLEASNRASFVQAPKPGEGPSGFTCLGVDLGQGDTGRVCLQTLFSLSTLVFGLIILLPFRYLCPGFRSVGSLETTLSDKSEAVPEGRSRYWQGEEACM